jgi:peptidoglycan hydrolase-like protein with peptidoglycan-binding domain
MIFGRSALLAVAAAIMAGTALAPCPAAAAPAHEAMVIGNGTYDALPALPGCLLSAHAVAAALRGAGFSVVEREDATSGATDAAIGEMTRALTAAPGATAFVYVCGYVTAFNDRTFLLPISANIVRPTDVLTQGVLAKSVLEMLTRGGAGSAVVVLDVVPAPSAPAMLGLDTALQGSPAGGPLSEALGAIAVSQTTPPVAPTPLAASLVANLKGSPVQIGPLVSAVQRELAANKGLTVAAIHQPAGPAYLVGGPPPAPPARPSAASAPAQAGSSPAAQPPAAAASATPPAAQLAGMSGPHATGTPSPSSAAAVLPADAEMTDADRRRVQTALARLGYYDGRIDGVFGADTRAAIRRYQHELHATMTGQLTAEQANKLAGGG